MLPTVIMVNNKTSQQQHFWHESEKLDHSPSSCILVVIMVHNITVKVINIYSAPEPHLQFWKAK